jgi:hypothetical protein
MGGEIVGAQRDADSREVSGEDSRTHLAQAAQRRWAA